MKIFKYTIMAILATSLFSCDFLDVEPLDSYTESNIFSDKNLTQAYVTRHYTLLANGFNHSALRFVCDESRNNFSWDNSYTLTRGEMTPDQYGGFGLWDSYYANIRSCNIFFDNIDKLEADEQDKNMLIGEMTFLRAYYYMDLVRRYGGVPLITKTFTLDDDMELRRNSYEECVDFIVKEFNKAAELLPLQQSGSNFGRATKGAALAMKARMLLHAASPQWNTNNDKSKWQNAADAAKAVIDLGVYSLDGDYKGLFLNPQSPEIIFERLYTSEYNNGFDWENTPNGWTGWSATCVLQDMVDSYEMEDGSMPDPAIYAKATENPWKGRDPRFYASIVCDGQTFRDGVADFWINEDGMTGGKDSEYGTDNWNKSDTHYTIRKFMDESLVSPWETNGSQPWVYCRLAELYLNYAEASFEIGNEEEARKYVNLIRERARAGKSNILPDITVSGDKLREAIRHERKIELAFEEHRWYDVRRWLIAERTDNGPENGIKIVKKSDGTKSYQIEQVDTRKFISPNHYLMPIPNSEIRKNAKLEQNPGYDKI